MDAVLENDAGQIAGIEVNAAETVCGDDFRGLRLLQRRMGSAFLASIVLYCGEESPVCRGCTLVTTDGKLANSGMHRCPVHVISG